MKTSKVLLLCSVLWITTAQAYKATYPELHDQDEFSLMGLLSDHGLHNLQDERWNLYGQGTFISEWKPAFPRGLYKFKRNPEFIISQSR